MDPARLLELERGRHTWGRSGRRCCGRRMRGNDDSARGKNHALSLPKVTSQPHQINGLGHREARAPWPEPNGWPAGYRAVCAQRGPHLLWQKKVTIGREKVPCRWDATVQLLGCSSYPARFTLVFQTVSMVRSIFASNALLI